MTLKRPQDEKIGKLIRAVLIFIIIGIIICQGGYFPWEYLSAVILLCIALLCIIKRKYRLEVNMPILYMVLGINVLYILSTIFVSKDKYGSILETFKFMCFTLSILVFSMEGIEETLLKGIYYGCVITGATGLLAYMDILSFNSAILKDGSTHRLQSFLQYANVTALLMGIGFLISLYYLEWLASYKKVIVQ